MHQKRLLLHIVSIGMLFVLTAVTLHLYGISRRRFVEPPRIQHIAEPYDAYNVWKSSGVAGRTLLIFDRHLRGEPFIEIGVDFKDIEASLAPINYVFMAGATGMVREIYHIIPDRSWNTVRETLSKDAYLYVPVGGGYRLTLPLNFPVVILRARDLPTIPERVMVSLNGDYWNEEGLRDILALLGQRHICADLMTVSGPIPEETLRELEKTYVCP